MTLPIALNPFPSPANGMDLPTTINNVRGQDNQLVTTLNAIITALGGGGLPISVPASHVTAGTFGAGAYAFVDGLKSGSQTQLRIGTTDDMRLEISNSTNTAMNLQSNESGVNLRALSLNPSGGVVNIGSVGVTSVVVGGLHVGQASALDGNLTVGASKFTVDASTGNTVVLGTLGVTGAITGNLTGNASTATTAGTVTTAAQPAITSVGTLTGLTVSGALALSNQLNFAGNIGVLSPSGNGQSSIGVSTALGAQIVGSGSSFDFVLYNKNTTPVITVATGTTNVTIAGTVGASNFSGSSSGTNTGDQTSVSGNAGTATKLATARNIWGQSFDGSAAISGALSGASTIDASSDISTTGGNLKVKTTGNGMLVAEGINATMGAAILSTGTVTVATNKVTSVSRIFISRQNDPSSLGVLPVDVISRVAGTSFTIQSSSALDNATVAWIIVEPA